MSNESECLEINEVIEVVEVVGGGDRATILISLEQEPLTDALEKLEEFARSQQQQALAQWANLELEGYSGEYLNHCPSYRIVALSYFDTGGQVVPSLSEQYGSYPLFQGVRKLELHLKNGLTLTLPAEVTDFLSQACNRPIYGGHVSPAQLKSLLTNIRHEAIDKTKTI